MADGKWVMNEEDARRVDLSYSGSGLQDLRSRPNYGRHIAVDDRGCIAEKKCAFCSSARLQTGFGGYGEGFGYKSFMCTDCGGTTDFVYKDEIGKYFGQRSKDQEI